MPTSAPAASASLDSGVCAGYQRLFTDVATSSTLQMVASTSSPASGAAGGLTQRTCEFPLWVKCDSLLIPVNEVYLPTSATVSHRQHSGRRSSILPSAALADDQKSALCKAFHNADFPTHSRDQYRGRKIIRRSRRPIRWSIDCEFAIVSKCAFQLETSNYDSDAGDDIKIMDRIA